ncbi:MAG: hypothetical protein GC159_08505 [Phycisphaera sp.]|nr:hypothetical protein [Phycisphaera sp.]
MKNGQIQLNDLKLMWRVVACVIVSQLIGGAVGLFVSMHYAAFMNFWLGGAMGTLPGFLVGLAWQFKSVPARRTWIVPVGFIGLIAVMLTGMVFGFVLPWVRGEMQRLDDLRHLRASDIAQIDVYDCDSDIPNIHNTETRIASITDSAAIAAFVTGAADVKGYSPNHPRVLHEWYVLITGTSRREYTLQVTSDRRGSITGNFVEVGDDATYMSSHGSFESAGLRAWMGKYVTTRDTPAR